MLRRDFWSILSPVIFLRVNYSPGSPCKRISGQEKSTLEVTLLARFGVGPTLRKTHYVIRSTLRLAGRVIKGYRLLLPVSWFMGLS